MDSLFRKDLSGQFLYLCQFSCAAAIVDLESVAGEARSLVVTISREFGSGGHRIGEQGGDIATAEARVERHAYDLMVNSALLGEEGVVDLIVKGMKAEKDCPCALKEDKRGGRRKNSRPEPNYLQMGIGYG